MQSSSAGNSASPMELFLLQQTGALASALLSLYVDMVCSISHTFLTAMYPRSTSVLPVCCHIIPKCSRKRKADVRS